MIGLFEFGVEKKPNSKVIKNYICQNIHGDLGETFFDNIYELPAGHYLEINYNNKITIIN